VLVTSLDAWVSLELSPWVARRDGGRVVVEPGELEGES
jgi:hypothetical protein